MKPAIPVEAAASKFDRSEPGTGGQRQTALAFVSTLAGFSPTTEFDESRLRRLGDTLTACLHLEVTEDFNLARVSAEILRILYLNEYAPFTAEAGAKLLEDPLCQALLTRTRNVDATLEVALKDYRRFLLMKYGPAWVAKRSKFGAVVKSMLGRFVSDGPAQDFSAIPSENDFRDAAIIALQNVESDYVQSFDSEENNLLNELRELIAAGPKRTNVAWSVFQSMCVFYGMYQPLHGLKNARELAENKELTWDQPAAAFMETALLLPMKVRAYAGRIDSLGKLEDRTSIAVKNQYEANPYPRWHVKPSPKPTTIEDFLSRMFPQPPAPKPPENEPYQLLVAGCGTGRQAISAALQFPDANIVATDVSLTSLGYTRLMCEAFGVKNMQVIQNDLLHSEALGKTFQLIECVGVLHHLEDPKVGLNILINTLAPGGFIRIGLYSRIGRTAIISARERIETLGFEATPDNMRAYREKIIFGHEPKAVWDIMRFPDFYNLSEFRDMLFNVKEHRFSLPEVQRLIESAGLTFLGFELPTADCNAYHSRFPEDEDMTDLDNWNTFEKEHRFLFSKMYVFWCQRPT